MREQLLPYSDPREQPVEMLVFHTSAYPAETLLHWLDHYRCSCHYIIDLDGSVIRSVPENRVAFHAGSGYWRGKEGNMNPGSVGIELCSLSLGQLPPAPAQLSALTDLAAALTQKYQIPAVNIVGHSDIAPLRKADPGPAFPWEALAARGIGLWPRGKPSAELSEPANPEKLLALIGYDTRSPEAATASAYAFCRRFLPELVTPDPDPQHLVDHFLPADNAFMQTPAFIAALTSVAALYPVQT